MPDIEVYMKTSVIAAFALLVATVPLAAQDAPAPTGARPALTLTPPPNAPPAKKTPPGPYTVSVESDPGLRTHTIYRPADLSSFSASNTLPIVSWGNGACANVGTLFETFLRQVASHGYFVISIGPKDAPLPSFATNRSGSANGEPTRLAAPQSRDEQLIDAIDWAVKENARKDSAYFQRLNTNRIAVMGQSCGGLQTIFASGDPRVKTSVLWNSGTFPNGADSLAVRISKARKEDLARLHAPIAYFIGGPTDIAYPNAEDDFKRITQVPVFKGNLNVGHGGTFRDPGAGWFGEVGVAWLNWQLKADANAGKYFQGADCLLCKSDVWKVEKKNIK
jgi:dienelactone hydrolase